MVQTISDAQAQGYLQAHLGQEKGHALYDRLDASLKSLARTPLLLKLIKDAGGGSDQLPHNRGELFDKYVMNKLLEREQKLELTETPETKKKALAHLAFALQLNHQLACDREWAEKILAEKGLGAKTDTIFKEALLHGLLIQQTLPDKQLLRFIHQSVQEYFVALTLLSEVKVEKNANLIQAASRRLSKRNLTDWVKDNWWAESFVQLAGLLDDADWLAQRIVNVNPWLAWWCVQEGRAVPENTREMIEARSIRLLHSPEVAVRRRAVQTLSQIKNDRVLEPLLIAAGDDDKEVAGLGLQALAENGKSTRLLIKKILQDEDRRAWKASFRYLGLQPNDVLCAEIPMHVWIETLGQPMVWISSGAFMMGSNKSKDAKAYDELPQNYINLGQPMVWMPSGDFLMGSKKSKNAEAYDNELPQHSITLPGYWIGQFPVTVAQWKAFVKESGYKSDDVSLQDPDNHPVRYVNWDDAIAYCKWLSEKSGLLVTLPTEAEWEKAARGTDGRIYPWGNEFDKDKCNTSESGINNTTPVGKYSPTGDSPYGCADMAGNVWEWTRSIFMPYPYKADDGRESLEDFGYRVVRGGSWDLNRVVARASHRYNYYPDLRDANFGFRLVVRPPKGQG